MIKYNKLMQLLKTFEIDKIVNKSEVEKKSFESQFKLKWYKLALLRI